MNNKHHVGLMAVVAALAAAGLLSGCASTISAAMMPSIKAEVAKQTGYDGEGQDRICTPEYKGDLAAFQQADMDCARKNAGQVLVGKTIVRYSEYKQPMDLMCQFIGRSRDLVPERISKGQGLLQPVLVASPSGIPMPDWKLTELMHARLQSNLRLRLLPLAETRRYHAAMEAWLTERGRNMGPMSVDFKIKDRRYHDQVLSKFSAAAYVVAPSNAMYEQVVISSRGRQNFEDMSALASRPPEKLTKQEFTRYTSHLRYLASMFTSSASQNNARAVMEFDLVEKFANMSPDSGGIFQQDFDRPACETRDLSINVVARPALDQPKPADGSGGTPGVLDSLKNMVNVDTSRGLEISIDESKNNGPEITGLRKELDDARRLYDQSVQRHMATYQNALIPFVAMAFEKMQLSGYVSSTRVK